MLGKQGSERTNPWERVPEPNQDYYTPDVMYYVHNWANKRPMFLQKEENMYLDIHTKRAALLASPSVVALVSYSGEQEMNQGSGTIIETDDNNVSIVLTSAHLIRRPSEENFAENALADNLKVVVLPSDGKSYDGEICAYDFHYNIVTIRFKTNSSLPIANVRLVDDAINLNPQHSISEETSFQLRHHSSSFMLVPGDAVTAVGRYFTKPFDLMAAPGEFSLDRCRYDCKELFMATCRITRCGDGGPLINHSGEVIGIIFYDYGFTPFMPINIAYKWWEQYKRYGEIRRPFMGMEATNFYAAALHIAEKVIQRFPSISKGVIVEKVIPGSSADSAGLRLNDVIIQCGGKAVRSFLELSEILFDNVGRQVDLVVARTDHVTPAHLKMMVVEAAPDKLNRWPHLEYR